MCQELARLFPADAIKDVREADLLRIKSSLQGTFVDRQLPRDIGKGAAAVGQLPGDQFLNLTDQIERIAFDQVGHKTLDGRPNVWISGIEHLVEKRFRKYPASQPLDRH